MGIKFDKIANASQVHLAGGEVEKTGEIKPGMIPDYDANGNVPGVEVLYVSKQAELSLKKAA